MRELRHATDLAPAVRVVEACDEASTRHTSRGSSGQRGGIDGHREDVKLGVAPGMQHGSCAQRYLEHDVSGLRSLRSGGHGTDRPRGDERTWLSRSPGAARVALVLASLRRHRAGVPREISRDRLRQHRACSSQCSVVDTRGRPRVDPRSRRPDAIANEASSCELISGASFRVNCWPARSTLATCTAPL